ncbi:MAG TPA: hypothetical protein VMZ50_06720 [Phycisphaerae bacterium]|nr:hypothetical protein [Phycisphaerae bacterium]
MSQVTYKSEKVSKKRVYYTGGDTLQEGYCLSYDRDYGTASASEIARAYRVEKPAAANLKYFAGVVAEEDSGKTGPCWVSVIEPQPNPGRLVKVYTDQDCTLGTTKLAVQNASYAAGAAGSSNVTVATAMQTVDRSETNGTVLAQLEGASSIEVDVAAAVSQTQQTLTAATGSTTGGTHALQGAALAAPTGSTTGGTHTLQAAALTAPIGSTTGGTHAMSDITGVGGTCGGAAGQNIENNFKILTAEVDNLRNDFKRVVTEVNALRDDLKRVVAEINAAKTDVVGMLTALKNANLMAS